MAEIHYFNTDVAAKYGVNSAVILQNIWHWIRHNEANEKNFHDGYYWTYNSTKAFKDLFPYLSQKQIETALKKLRDDEIIITGNYNEMKYDRTLWYAITEKGKSILLLGEMETPKKGNGIPENGEPIPNNKPILKTSDKNTIKNIVDYLNEKAGKKFKASTASTQHHINARLAEGFELDDFKVVIDKKCHDWLETEWEQYLRPATLFGTKFESYLNAPVFEKKKVGAAGIEINPAADEDDDLPF